MELLDFHAHVLPHLDHGSRHTSTSVEQMALIYAAGVHTVCATSHFYPERVLPSAYLAARAQWLEHLLDAMGDTPRPAIIPSAETLICDGMENMEDLSSLCFEGTNVLLLEMPFDTAMWTRRLTETVYGICDRGILPVLAHVDRYPQKLMEPLLQSGIRGQINADALTRFFKPRHLLEWIDKGYIVALGSDLHGSDAKGYDAYRKVVASMPERTEMLMQASGALLRDAVRH